MQLTLSRDSFSKALSVMSSTISPRSESPYLVSTYMMAHKDSLTLESTNLESSARISMEIEPWETGSALLPTRLLANIVKVLPEEEFELYATNTNATIVCGSAHFTIPAFNPDDFPRLIDVSPDQSIKVPAHELYRLIRKAISAVDAINSRFAGNAYEGVLICAENGVLRITGTDSHRVSYDELSIEDKTSFRAIMPASFAKDILNYQYDETIELGVSQGQISVSFGGDIFITRGIEGTFVDVRKFFPQEFNDEAVVCRKEIIESLARSIAMSQTAAPEVLLDFEECSDGLVVSSEEKGAGSFLETIEIDPLAGDAWVFKVNAKYLLDALKNIPGEIVKIHPPKEGVPIFLTWEESGNSFYAISPIRLGEIK